MADLPASRSSLFTAGPIERRKAAVDRLVMFVLAAMVGAFVLLAGMGRCVLAASCTLAVMTLPVIITSTREALAAVPRSFREACWNMGASRWQTIRTIVLPNSIAGILTGVILQVSRAAGETAPILFTGAVFYTSVDSLPYGPRDPFMALSYHLFALATQVKDVSQGLQYGTAVVLIRSEERRVGKECRGWRGR